MTVPVLSAARHLARRSGWTLSNLQLQKILYLAHMVYLAEHEGEPLVEGSFEAWDYGPVHPKLYHRAKPFGGGPVADVFHDAPDLPPGPERALLDQACDQLARASAGQLVNATHRDDGAWAMHYVPGRRHNVIPNRDILEEYQTRQRVTA